MDKISFSDKIEKFLKKAYCRGKKTIISKTFSCYWKKCGLFTTVYN